MTSADAATNCAFDLFHYHNHRSSSANGSQRTDMANCGPHIDRGYLSALVFSPVPGLLLRDTSAGAEAGGVAAGGAAEGGGWVEPHRRWPGVHPHP